MASRAAGKRSQILQWSPHESEVFAVRTSEHLKLYSFAAENEMQMLGSVRDVPVNCRLVPDAAQPWTLAAGTHPGASSHDLPLPHYALVGIHPTVRLWVVASARLQRNCTAAAWNRLQTQQVAVGLDPLRLSPACSSGM